MPVQVRPHTCIPLIVPHDGHHDTAVLLSAVTRLCFSCALLGSRVACACYVSVQCSSTVPDAVYEYHTHPWAEFLWSISPQQVELCRCQKDRRWKHLAKSFPRAYRSVLALTPSWLSSDRPWKTAPGGCNIHRCIRSTVGFIGKSSGIVQSSKKSSVKCRTYT